MLGHALRPPTDTPAQQAIDQYLNPGKRKRGRPQANLVTKLQEDLNEAGIRFKTQGDLINLRELASDRKSWQQVIRMCNERQC